jgi:hypothetical protein
MNAKRIQDGRMDNGELTRHLNKTDISRNDVQ